MKKLQEGKLIKHFNPDLTTPRTLFWRDTSCGPVFQNIIGVMTDIRRTKPHDMHNIMISNAKILG